MKNYFIQFGIWLGGAYILLYILGYTGIMMNLYQALGEIAYYFPVIDLLILLIGIILAVIMTHKAENKRINFGKAFLAGLTILFAFFIIGMVLLIARTGGENISFILPFKLIVIGIEILLLLSILLFTGAWYMVEKANQPGWGLLIPIYNIIILLRVSQKPLWYIAMFFIPIANIVFIIMMLNGISKSFGKSSGFTVGLVFLRQIFFAVLGYGDAKYMTAGNNSNEEVLDL